MSGRAFRDIVGFIERRPHRYDRDISTVQFPNGSVAQATDPTLIAALCMAARDAVLAARKARTDGN